MAIIAVNNKQAVNSSCIRYSISVKVLQLK